MEKDGAAPLYGGLIVSRGVFLILIKARFDVQIISAVFAGSVIRERFGKLVRHGRAWCHMKSVRNCARDEGRPLGVGLQEQASKHLKLRWLRARVVSVKEKSRHKIVAGRDRGDERNRTTDEGRLHRLSEKSLLDLSRFNLITRGWLNYYGSYYRSAPHPLSDHINRSLKRWAMRKFKRLRGRQRRAAHWLRRIRCQQPGLFAHWQLASRLLAGR